LLCYNLFMNQQSPEVTKFQELALKEVIGDYKSFVSELLAKVSEAGIDVKDYPIDHLCYRAETSEDYESVKAELSALSAGVLENAHHGRLVAKFLLSHPIAVEGYTIPVIEVPSPKPGHIAKTGLEHFEMVVGGDYEVLKSQHRWSGMDDSGPHNQPVYITFESGNSVKFHKLPITEVVRLEGNSFVKPSVI
jgi:uncharacterized protein